MDVSVKKNTSGLVASFLIAVGVTQPAWAQGNSSRLLEEVVVTAQKRAENAQDVPISLSAFSGEKLEAMGIDNAQDLQRITPGLVYSTGPIQYSLIYIRGIGTDVFIPSADSSVATYLDGVYFPYAHGIAGSFTEVERIEVLKGPQGTLFGRNTTGGAINIVTRNPGEETLAKVKLRYGRFDEKNVRVYGQTPITDAIAVGLSAFKTTSESYYDPSPDSPVQSVRDREESGAHLKLRFDFNDKLSLDLAGLITDSTAPLVNSIENTKPAGESFRPNDTRPYDFESNVDGFFESKDVLYYGTLSWSGDLLAAKLFASTQSVEGQTLYDFDGGPGNGVYFDVPDEFVDANSLEFQLQSVPDGWLTFDSRVEWTLGYYYFDSIGGYGSVYFGLAEPNQPGAAPVFGIETLLAALSITGMGDNIEIVERGTVDTESDAFYGQATWDITDRIALTLGGRYQDETRATVVSESALSMRPSEEEVPLFTFEPKSTTTTNFSPKVALDFRPFDDATMIYMSAQKGFKSGTYNVVSLDQEPAYVEPEEVEAFEIGVKGDWLDGALTYAVAAFQNNLENLQTLNISLASGGSSQLSNAAKAKIEGADYDITWQVAPESIPGLVMTTSGAYLNGAYEDFKNGAGFDEETGVYFGPGQQVPSERRDFSGNETVRTPKFSGTLGLDYLMFFDSGEMEMGVNASYNSGYYFDTQNTEEQDEHVLYGARISYLHYETNLRLSLQGANLGDELYYSDKLINDFGTNSFYAPPATYSISVSWQGGDI